MLSWQELRQLPGAELGNKDLATVNLACAAGLPGEQQAFQTFVGVGALGNGCQPTSEPSQPVPSGPLTLEPLLRMSDGERARVDIAEMNLVCARGLPGAAKLDVEANLRIIDESAEVIREATERTAHRFESNPAAYDNSRATFRVVTMVLILQRNLGMIYNAERKKNLEGGDFFKRPQDIFIHGILSGNGGTCASVPALCVAVGRRLGYPLTLVSTMSHQFCRWDEPGGERVNFEASSEGGLNTYPDDHYRRWPVPVPPEIEKSCGFLRNHTAQGDLSSFLMTRGLCWMCNGIGRKALKCFGWASLLAPGNPEPLWMVDQGLKEWKERLRPQLAPELPPISLTTTGRVWLNLTWEAERQIVQLAVVEDLLRDKQYKQLVDQVKREGRLPEGAPKRIKVEYPAWLMYDI